MESNSGAAGFKIWGVDNIVYGPVELPVLVNWVKDERVTADTWIFSENADAWSKAPQVAELRMFFDKPSVVAAGQVATGSDSPGLPIKPRVLRRIKILADLNDDQLIRFVQFLEIQPVRQWTEIVKQGQHGDAMYFLLEGELRVRMMIGGKETILVTLGPGEFFGEIALFDHGPRSADVIANADSTLLKVTAAAFQNVITQAPDLAAPFLFAMGKTLTARIRADNKRYRDSVNFAQASGR